MMLVIWWSTRGWIYRCASVSDGVAGPAVVVEGEPVIFWTTTTTATGLWL